MFLDKPFCRRGLQETEGEVQHWQWTVSEHGLQAPSSCREHCYITTSSSGCCILLIMNKVHHNYNGASR